MQAWICRCTSTEVEFIKFLVSSFFAPAAVATAGCRPDGEKGRNADDAGALVLPVALMEDKLSPSAVPELLVACVPLSSVAGAGIVVVG